MKVTLCAIIWSFKTGCCRRSLQLLTASLRKPGGVLQSCMGMSVARVSEHSLIQPI